ncbi:MAG: hypothetical protein EOP23_19505 [Hyphomicrobiales bacterium]|nr:MAG: hypothetical protein EOP23_19505 [Hyphomicrobiales bacterium]
MSRENAPPAVGYKRPPQHSRFRKGQSGNPSGRRKAAPVLDVMSLFEDVLAERIMVTRKGRSQAVTKLEVIIRQTIDGAMKGDASAKRDLFKYLELREKLRAASQPLEVDHGEHEEELKERFRAREAALAEGGGDE